MKYLAVTRTLVVEIRKPLSSYANMTLDDAIQFEKRTTDWSDQVDFVAATNVLQTTQIDVFDDGKVE
jgi:hypothetical protein